MKNSTEPWYWVEKDAWYVVVHGRRVRLAKGKANKAEARRRWHEVMGGGAPAPSVPLKLCIERYLAKVSPSSLRTRQQTLDAFARHVGKVPADKLTAPHVESFLKPSWSPSTARSHVKTIHACLNKAVKDKLLKANPLAGMEKPAWERREQVLTGEELAKLLGAAREPFRTLLRAMAETGCRPQEICGLLAENCHPDRNLWLVANKTKGKTGVKFRPIFLTPEMADLTRGLMEGRTEGHLFRNRHGDPWKTDTVRCRFARLRDKLGLSKGVMPYGVRHRFASDAINKSGLDSLVVAKLIGHSDPKMLHHTYFREETDAMVEAMKKARGG